ncbi:ATP-dependent DNA ligase, partial [Candidatus Woesearchaeota archaeon]|nr:ATP-dependent DNA ligase [Candidatus Woesearchaeota archaeon]
MDYLTLCNVYEQLESTSRRLEKTAILADFLKIISSDELEQVLLLVQGLAYPAWDERTLGFSSSSIIKALSLAAGASEHEVRDAWRETGDLGDCAFRLMGKRKQATLFEQKLTIRKVFENIRKLAEIEGEHSVDIKVGTVAELLSSATAAEARFIVRTVLDELRIGLGEGTLRDALVWAFLPGVLGISVPYKKGDSIGNALVVPAADAIDELQLACAEYVFSEDEKVAREVHSIFVRRVQHALDVCNDFGKVASVLKKKGLAGLNTLRLAVGTPLKVMLALKAESIEAAFECVGKPAALEYKLDGFRLQVHKKNGKISLFTRRLEQVTAQFPDVAAAVENHLKGNEFILDCEAVGVDKVSGKFLPFQNISQRIKRKYGLTQMADDVPVELHIFDILFFDGKSFLDDPFSERRALLRKVVDECEHVKLVMQLWTDDVEEAAEFYQQALDAGNEGIMFKSLNAAYQPGSRVGAMVKMKPVMET